jgi:hypothetical protein
MVSAPGGSAGSGPPARFDRPVRGQGLTVTIAGRFHEALIAADAPGLGGPALLPVRLAAAAARMLKVDGAGISLTDAEGRRVPLGASSEDASRAERLQFTTGGGPCMTAQETRQPVFAIEEDMVRRWPVFADLLLSSTPFRAVVALPLRPALAGDGAMDLFFTRPDEVTDLDVFEALAVGELVTSALSEAAVWSTWSAATGPEWLQGPLPHRRAAVWEAIGRLGVDLEITAPEALALMRGHAYGSGRSVDDVAADLLTGRLHPGQLQEEDRS